MRDAEWFIDRVTKYVKEREVFGRPIGKNQGKQLPIAESCIDVEAATLMRWKVCELSDGDRKFRETRLYQVAPISTHMVLSYGAEHVLGLPRSY